MRVASSIQSDTCFVVFSCMWRLTARILFGRSLYSVAVVLPAKLALMSFLAPLLAVMGTLSLVLGQFWSCTLPNVPPATGAMKVATQYRCERAGPSVCCPKGKSCHNGRVHVIDLSVRLFVFLLRRKALHNFRTCVSESKPRETSFEIL